VRLRRIFDILRTLCFFAGIIAAIVYFNQRNLEVLSGKPVIIDGDSLKLEGQELRLIGIDAPEYSQTCKNADQITVYQCGKLAREHLIKLLSVGKLSCEGSQQDKYDRLLAICMVDGFEINSQMVSDGWALAFGSYYKEETSAEKAKRGVWAGEFQTPSAWRKDAKEAHSVDWLSNLYDRLFK